eukprot:3526232-Amphidinium_carterae.1
MNVVYAENDVVSDCGDPRPTPRTPDGQWWMRRCDNLCLLTSLWTHRHLASRTLRSLDRIYCNVDMVTLMDLHPVTVIHGSSSSPPGGSDLWPVRLTWLASTARSVKHGLPPHITKHPQFETILKQELDEMQGGLCWTATWEAFKVCLATASKHIEDLPDIATSTCHLRCAASLRCLRAWRQSRTAFRNVLIRCEGWTAWTHVTALRDEDALCWLQSCTC